MASDQCTGAEIILYAESPAGNRTVLFKGVNEQTGPGGSPDGVQATVKANELPRMALSDKQLPGGFKIVPAVKLKVADGVDASDCVFNIPVTDVAGNVKYLTAADLGISTDLPASSPANVELDLGTGYELANNEALVLGGSDGSQGATYFMSVENDAA
jgi:hypothetical protein